MAFPTTTILDNFNRANENPLSDGGKWTNPLISGEGARVLTSNAVPINGTNSGYWSDSTLGAHQEGFLTVLTAEDSPDYVGVIVSTFNENTATLAGHIL